MCFLLCGVCGVCVCVLCVVWCVWCVCVCGVCSVGCVVCVCVCVGCVWVWWGVGGGVSYTYVRVQETKGKIVCRLLL